MHLSKQKVHLFLRLSIAVGIIGILFKVMHWPFGLVLLVIGILGIAVFYSIRFYNKPKKRPLDYAKLFLLISFLLHYSFRIFNLPYEHLFTLLFQISLVIFLIFYVKDVFFPQKGEGQIESENRKKKSIHILITYLLYGIAAIGIILGSQLKILHWKFGFINGNILLIVGLLAAIVAVSIDYSKSKS